MKKHHCLGDLNGMVTAKTVASSEPKNRARLENLEQCLCKKSQTGAAPSEIQKGRRETG